MNCQSCKHYTLIKGNDLCNRVRTFSDMRTRETPVFCVLERSTDNWGWSSVNRRLDGDVCGENFNHWSEK
jgi:hypothetical protein